MRYIADLHIHSKYSRATSKEMDLEHLDKWAKIKGIDILSTGDFTHPVWFKELKDKLEMKGEGVYGLKSVIGNSGKIQDSRLKIKDSTPETKFILTTEISCIYSKGGKCRRMHNLIFAPSLEVVEEINKRLAKIGNIHSDGRPILGLDSKELLKIVLDVSPDCLFVPAHIWTPWFALFGSKSGFDSMEECFGEMTPYIYAIETGLSSDVVMNRRWSALDKITLISNSDAHSPANLGREANVFDFEGEISYQKIIEAVKTKKGFDYTIEFFPEEGKYHYDGHRLCKICFSPAETKKHQGLCPVCKKPLVIGVMNRAEELADREAGYLSDRFVPYKSLVPLPEIIAGALNKGKNTKVVNQEYNNLIKNGGSEFKILLDLSVEELSRITLPEIAAGIISVRQGKIKVSPGYDGVYGTVEFSEEIKKPKQKNLF